MIVSNTPIESYRLSGKLYVDVKREDLCVVDPNAPPFSKMRGLHSFLKNNVVGKYEGVAYVESSVSMAGWGVAYVGKKLGLKTIIFEPIYVGGAPELLAYHKTKWVENGAEIIPLKAGRVSVLNHQAKKILPSNYLMLPTGLCFQDSIVETGLEFAPLADKYASVVSCIGSGTIFAGLLLGAGLSGIQLHGVLTRNGSLKGMLDKLKKKSGCGVSGFFGRNVSLYNPGFEYSEFSDIRVPFPCHPYYDAKAWWWLKNNYSVLKFPVLFWNIGNQPSKD